MTDEAAIQNLLKELRDILQDDFILTEETQLRPFECDGLSAYRQLPKLAVLPEDEQQVQAIIRLSHKYAVPIVTRGAGTGLSAGALPHPEGLLLVLSRMSKILEINPAMTARVQPGVRNLAISEAAGIYDLFMRRILLPRSPAQLAATSLKTPAVSTV